MPRYRTLLSLSWIYTKQYSRTLLSWGTEICHLPAESNSTALLCWGTEICHLPAESTPNNTEQLYCAEAQKSAISQLNLHQTVQSSYGAPCHLPAESTPNSTVQLYCAEVQKANLWLIHHIKHSTNCHSFCTLLAAAAAAAAAGGSFFLACKDFWRMFDHSFPVSAFFFFFLKWRLAHAH